MNEPSDAGPPSLASLWNAPPPAERKLDLAFLPAQIRSIPAPVAKFLIKALRVDALMPVFNGIAPQVSAEDFCLGALKNLNINLVLDEDLAQRIPKEGPLVIMSNHPFGGLDGLALMAALLPHRPDFKVLINVALGIFPELRAAALPLDVLSGTAKAAAGNTGSLRAAGAHLQAGGAVGFFPSGVVSHYRRGMGVVDPEWQMAGARLARRFNAPVLPVFFHGRNSLLFSVAGMIHPLARTLLLPREMVLRGGRPIRMSVGRVIEPGTFKILGTAESLTAYSRMRCYALLYLAEGQSLTQAAERPMEPVADPHAPEAVAAALAELPEDALLHREGDYAIYVVRGGQSPLLLEELGALREHTFRLVGEGSGKARDLDIYDERYHHLLLWHEKDRQLAGAYRLGMVQDILAESGPAGLYTSTLFRMNDEFFRRYGNALELGRALVHPNYQREYAPLMLLWKGIARFVLRREDLHCLFGPVSLSLDYAPSSLRTVVEYLREQCGSTDLAGMVRGRNLPDKLLSFAGGIPLPEGTAYNDLAALVRDIEGGRGIPILFKHYLKLGGKIGAFHIDTAFNTLDAFLLMDLLRSPKHMLERYMTPEGAALFLSSRGQQRAEAETTASKRG